MNRPNLSGGEMGEIMAFDRGVWRAEVMRHEELFPDLHDRLPDGIDLRARAPDLPEVSRL
ncbi:MAG: hypothetical protein ABI222_03120 [Opitutaceae bacterium]